MPADAQDSDKTLEGTLLTRSYREGAGGLTFELWLATVDGPARVRVTDQRAVMFVEREVETDSAMARRPVDLRSLRGRPVDALYFDRQRALVETKDALMARAITPLEADLNPLDRFLMERFITGAVRATGRGVRARGDVRELENPRLEACDVRTPLRALAIDIETRGLDGPLLSIAAVGAEIGFCGMVGQGPRASDLHYFPDDRALLRAFLELVARVDPDVLIGWNLIEFDLRYLQQLCRTRGMRLALGRAGGACDVLAPRSRGQPYVARMPGRVALDGIACLRNASLMFESFALEDVAQELLGRGKQIEGPHDRVAEIERLYAEDKPALARYNLEDCQLVREIFERTSLLALMTARQALTGLPLDRQGGSVAAFDRLYLPRLHRKGFVAPTRADRLDAAPSPGGYVMDSRPGLFRNVLVLDFKSLYPSIIRTFLVDPLGLARQGQDAVPGFADARFSRTEHVLPELITQLWVERDRAKRAQDATMSYVIKILMNSFYGVLGTPGCRFFNPQLATSITRRGHEIIKRSRDQLERQGLSVIYGDTDSLFVRLDPDWEEATCRATGQRLAGELNEFWRAWVARELDLPCALEVEFETHFLRFVMPTMRDSDKGSKKRYAGLSRTPDGGLEVIFKGLEAVRSDWTPAARRFQRELYRRVLRDEPYEEFVRAFADDLRAGRLDHELIYRKRLRRDLAEYRRNVPPHVQAARKARRPGRHIEYVMTTRGPEPLDNRGAPLDYEHYLERQLAPAADGILQFLGTSFDHLGGTQLWLF